MLNLLIIFCAKYLIALPVIALFSYFLMAPRRIKYRLFWLAFISLPLAYALARLAGHLYYDARPFVVGNFVPLVAHVADNGFPSDHMLFASALAMLGLYFNRSLGVFLWIVAILIGLSRVGAGVHHFIDIAASAVIATVAVLIAHFALYYLRRKPTTRLSD
ncbi:MAG: phosphatase PAP2 family protein [Patescibacteria group bacterium]|nr:phosphatase PAP2 family protein [Patescibacteria group bacterium]